MLQTVTKFDTQISVSLMLGFVFLLAGLYWTSNDNVSSNKYQRWDYGGLLFFYTPMLLLFFLSKAGYFEGLGYIGIFQKPLFFGVLFFAIGLLWSGSINVHFRKEIDSDTAYKFGVSSFVSGWIVIFWLLAEFLR